MHPDRCHGVNMVRPTSSHLSVQSLPPISGSRILLSESAPFPTSFSVLASKMVELQPTPLVHCFKVQTQTLTSNTHHLISADSVHDCESLSFVNTSLPSRTPWLLLPVEPKATPQDCDVLSKQVKVVDPGPPHSLPAQSSPIGSKHRGA